MAKARANWKNGAIFAVPLKDGSFAYGQAVDLMMPNVVYCSFFDIRTDALLEAPPIPTRHDIISCVAVSREQLDYKAWPIVGDAEALYAKEQFSNEKFASDGYVGAVIHDAALAEDFLNSFYRLLPWDDWYDPDYLDEFLISLDKKPKKLLCKKDLTNEFNG